MRTLRMSLLFVLVVTVGMGAAVGARMLTEREPAPKAGPVVKQADAVPFVVTKPGGKQVKLTRTVPSRAGGFTVKAPARSEVMPKVSEESLLGLSLPSVDDVSAFFVVTRVTDGERDPVASLRGKLPDSDPKVRALRRTQVAGKPAAMTDRLMKGKQRFRQFRFVHDGQMYGVGISYIAGDRVALDTGLAVLASWQWTA